MIRVALDTNALYMTRAGTARYIKGLKKGLSTLAHPELEFFNLAWPVENLTYRQPQRSLKTFYRDLIWAPLVAPSMLRRERVDILHSAAGFFISPPNDVRNVVTLHDLAVIRHPERYRRWGAFSGARRTRKTTQADAIICVSQFTADEAMKLLGLPASKLHVIHHGIDKPGQSNISDLSRLGVELPPTFFLFVGSLEPGKNLALLRAVYGLAAAREQALPPLVVVGARWEGVPREGPAPSNWLFLGQQPDGVLFYLYRKALALIFPSKYEGFGLPVVEAQICGCPVICSPIASLQEVGGKGALYVDLTPEHYLQAMQRVLTNDSLRSELIAAGRENSSRFSWEKCAAETVAVYHST